MFADEYSGSQHQKSDLFAVLLSFLAGIIQLLLFVVGVLSQVTNVPQLFFNPEVVPFVVILSLLVSLCVVGIISFARKNQSLGRPEPRLKLWKKIRKYVFEDSLPSFFSAQQKEKRNMLIAGTMLIIAAGTFLVSTLNHLSGRQYLFVHSDNAGLLQLFSFGLMWILIPVILFVWISNELEKARQYKPENFISNLIRSLHSHGYIQIKIESDVQLNDGRHVVRIGLQGEKTHFLTQFDGKRIERELTEEEYNRVFNKKRDD